MATPRMRTSNAPVELRASVLDAALNLGIRNSMMAKWMFDPIQEAEDGDEVSASFQRICCLQAGLAWILSPFSLVLL